MLSRISIERRYLFSLQAGKLQLEELESRTLSLRLVLTLTKVTFIGLVTQLAADSIIWAIFSQLKRFQTTTT
ncbi:unnamed protein product [Oikopleura dioica]|uniref:Uncharacterized protein n=1 Tax=Oikopleura dioica TaxID=34765 RepID=E4Y0W5_OIKDI|nr:unnamed protein product [Oikopleura dioica]